MFFRRGILSPQNTPFFEFTKPLFDIKAENSRFSLPLEESGSSPSATALVFCGKFFPYPRLKAPSA